MKKNLILLVCLFLGLGLNAQYKDWSKWSLTLEGGLNRFDGDIRQDYNALLPTALDQFTFGGSLEYTLTPVWSMGLEYYYLPLKASQIATVGTNTNFIVADFKSKMHNVDYFMSFNLIRAFYPSIRTKWGLWANVGLGYAWYKSTYYTDRDGQGVTDGHGNHYVDFSDTIPDGRATVVPLTMLLEYNMTRSLALGLKYQYRAYNKDYIEQRIQHGVTNDFVQMLTLQLRLKFNAVDEKHTRNDYLENNFDDLNKRVDDLNNRVNGIVIPAPDPRIDDLNDRVKKLEDYLDIDGPDDDNDGVANSRDQEPNTPAGNQVDFWGRTIPKGSSYDPAAFIFFDFDKTDLDEEAHKAIRIAAEKLSADPELLVEVRGFTDNMGTNAYNADLSQRRADKVKNELVNAYGIEADRIVANGKGKYNPDDRIVPYRPYRTAAFFYSK